MPAIANIRDMTGAKRHRESSDLTTTGIFGDLHENAFLVFSRDNKQLYAKAILGLYREFYGTLHFRSTPRRIDVCDFIAEILRQNPELWTEAEKLDGLPDTAARRGRQRRKKRVNAETADPVALKADRVYSQLLDCGWIEEYQIGFQTISEMPTAAQALAERFHEIDLGLSQFLGGVVIEIRNALNSLEAKPKENALGLQKGVESATSFIRRLRAIHGSLRSIERDLVQSADLKERLRTFFDDFMGRILIQDFKAILTTNHPYRFKNEIIRLAEALLQNPVIIGLAAEGYVQTQVAESQEKAEHLVAIHLEQIVEAFQSIAEAFRRINEFRMRIESRLRNTVSNMDRVNNEITARLIATIKAISKTEEALAATNRPGLRYPGQVSLPLPRLDPGDSDLRAGSLAVPPKPRIPIDGDDLPERFRDPILAELRRLEEHWITISDPTETAAIEWLDSKINPGETLESTMLHIAELEDFFAFIKGRNLLVEKREFGDYRIEMLDTERVDDWLVTPNFRITRKLAAERREALETRR
jgi:hypothetical protein